MNEKFELALAIALPSTVRKVIGELLIKMYHAELLPILAIEGEIVNRIGRTLKMR
jgi:hypothetical protein